MAYNTIKVFYQDQEAKYFDSCINQKKTLKKLMLKRLKVCNFVQLARSRIGIVDDNVVILLWDRFMDMDHSFQMTMAALIIIRVHGTTTIQQSSRMIIMTCIVVVVVQLLLLRM